MPLFLLSSFVCLVECLSYFLSAYSSSSYVESFSFCNFVSVLVSCAVILSVFLSVFLSVRCLSTFFNLLDCCSVIPMSFCLALYACPSLFVRGISNEEKFYNLDTSLRWNYVFFVLNPPKNSVASKFGSHQNSKNLAKKNKYIGEQEGAARPVSNYTN